MAMAKYFDPEWSCTIGCPTNNKAFAGHTNTGSGSSADGVLKADTSETAGSECTSTDSYDYGYGER